MSSISVQEAVRNLQNLASGRSDVWYLRGYIVFHCLFALSEVGFFNDLTRQGALDIKAYAKKKQLNDGALEAIARYLFGLGILNKDEQGHYYADVEVTDADLATIEMFYAYDPLFHNLKPLLKNEKVYGQDIHRFAELDARATAKICKNYSYPKLVEIMEKRGAQRVLDLGCGAAELLIQLCKRNPEVMAYGVDLAPEAIAYARERIHQEQLGDRIKVGVGDILSLDQDTFLTYEGQKEIDLIISAAVFHEFAYKDTQGLIQALEVVKRAFNGTTLILSEAQEQSDKSLRENPIFVLEHHLFHRLSMQGIASAEDWHSAFAKAGWALQEEILLPGGIIFIIH